MNCQHRFTTYERIEFVTITVIKRDGKKESFNKSKLLRGIIRSCEKTGIEVSQLEAFVNQIEVKLQGRCQREITSAEIGEIVLSSEDVPTSWMKVRHYLHHYCNKEYGVSSEQRTTHCMS